MGGSKKVIFQLPKKGTLSPNGPEDALSYYYHPLVGWLYRARSEQTLSLLEGFSFENILEIGYGGGVMMPSLQKVCRKLSGIDISSDSEKITKNLAPLAVHPKLTKGDVRKMPYADGSFDLVVAFSMLQYFADPECVIREIARVLKPSGYLLIGVPRSDQWMDFIFKMIGFNLFGQLAPGNYSSIRAAIFQKGFLPLSQKQLPVFLPAFAGLYYSGLFQRGV